MNKARRKNLAALQASIQVIMGNLEAIIDEEQEYYDNMPEALQQGERGTASDDALTALREASDALGTADGYIDEAIG
ncbi:MAG: hypothetical protein ACRYFX_19855 [Janthinobacterium lividum]